MQAQQCVRTLPMVLAVCLLATSVLRAQAPAPSPPPSATKGQAASDLMASYLTPPDANGRRQKKEVRLSDFKGQNNVVLALFPTAFPRAARVKWQSIRKHQGSSMPTTL